ncbi:rho GTPase-activating protein 7 isoform X2 [Macrosteles quadrilineatus]|uniref:rho GTPase-activating protein 7 isoform X2 n=1 Tax=Macrosteles quadrilineatus TaxID=74068 RepID=UPI0023E17277|nr:rho GTPase-activating protein 7 isoform X2 [Macrosteles quadrilineatus]
MDTMMRGDERAAGVISGADPYRELELYLEKVSEEIGEVFDRWKSPAITSGVPPLPPPRKKPPPPPQNGRRPYQHLYRTNSLPSPKKKNGDLDKTLNAWSEGLLAEFNTIIANELTTLLAEHDIENEDDIFLSDDESMIRSRSAMPRSKSLGTPPPSPATSPSTSDTSSGSSGSSGRLHRPLWRRPPRSQMPRDKAAPVLLRVTPIDTEGTTPTSCEETSEQDSLAVDEGVACCDSEESSSIQPPEPQHPHDVYTQTSPAVSRCSSLTWLSDCSSSLPRHSPESETDDRSTSSADSSTARDEPESGIGTASPPHPRHTKPPAQKCKRKETWERLRRRQSVNSRAQSLAKGGDPWVRRESFKHHLLESSSDPDLTLPRPRAVRPNCLPLPLHSPATSTEALPSPSTSLQLSPTPMVTELGNKSSSAPILHKQPPLPSPKAEDCNKRVLKQPRSQSERQLTEIEAAEACKWLRAAGFPQYAQMYEDLQFPIDVSGVQKDHPFLEPDSLQSLFRRLHTLNRCANMKVDNVPKSTVDDSDEEDQCALSENWTFQPESRRWSRVCDVAAQRLLNPNVSQQQASPSDQVVIRYGSLPPGAITTDSELLAARFRRSGSERLRDGAKAFLRRVESLKSRRRKRQHREGVIISGPQVLDVVSMQQRMKELGCVDVSPPESPSLALSDDPRVMRRLLSRPDCDSGALSDSEVSWRQHYLKDANSNHTKVLELLEVRPGGSREKVCQPASRSGSLNMGYNSQHYRDKLQKRSGSDESAYFTFDHEPETACNPTCMQAGAREETESAESSSAVADSDSELTPKHSRSVVRWHSFQRGSVRPDSLAGRCISSMSCGQLLVLRKLALLKLTAIMERYCPTHRTGWNWELPKFIRKIKTPDYKDKTVFGVPLVVSLQRSGQALPVCIQAALTWLRTQAVDQVGLFRKPGVRSRIQRLKNLAETHTDDLSFEGQQAYDVADMVKQYFRELPEVLLTNKLSETFVAIFQHVPVNLRTEAVQCALLLLPDEHREALLTLLDFLYQVSMHSSTNQMTASNLAVCLAPSLFHWQPTPSRSSSVSPRRRNKSTGVPDAKELGQNKAAHDCLLTLIKQHRELFSVSEEMLSQCHFSYMEESVPVALEELGAELQQDWRGYLYACTTALLKEARDKSRGWVSISAWNEVDMAYKKVGDGHPLRLWRASTEVEAPPTELLHRVLRERHLWDTSLLKWRVVARLEPQAEVFQYVTSSMAPLPAKDYCVLRSWRTEMGKGACVIVETSVEHSEGAVLAGGVRGIVLASRYLIEPCGSGRSRIMHLSRVDTKGRTPEWYNKSYGHLCAIHLARIRSSFKHSAEGPESKV